MASPRLLRGRQSLPGACYALTLVTADRRPLFVDAGFVRLLANELERCEHSGHARNIAWLAMPDHLHWLMQLHCGSLSACVQAFKSCSARAINAARDAAGALWQPGFYDHRLRGDEDIGKHARYILENPVRSGLARNLEAYPHWSCPGVASLSDLHR
jgi:putative transposase